MRGGKKKSDADIISSLEFSTQVFATAFYCKYMYETYDLNEISEFVTDRLGDEDMTKKEKINYINEIMSLLQNLIEQGHDLETRRVIKLLCQA